MKQKRYNNLLLPKEKHKNMEYPVMSAAFDKPNDKWVTVSYTFCFKPSETTYSIQVSIQQQHSNLSPQFLVHYNRNINGAANILPENETERGHRYCKLSLCHNVHAIGFRCFGLPCAAKWSGRDVVERWNPCPPLTSVINSGKSKGPMISIIGTSGRIRWSSSILWRYGWVGLLQSFEVREFHTQKLK